ncbi:hypothetical protein SteCoe_10409 [Stentor coeruleus]|uniref:Uncharacterized protein n=1 Tax=Stentor coeruleus TaxID=5963 RepID=A0A1R2CFP5_9CILI|nr:hypothetical protein SteCoe_10409 [Stentor coeruleus]
MALPNLKQKLQDLPSSVSKNSIVKPATQRHDSSFSIQRSVEILENLDFLKTPHHHKSHSTHILLFKEFGKIEQELDSNEIRMLRFPLSSDQQFKIYKDYLESIFHLLKAKDEKLSRVLCRGLLGCEKSFFRLLEESQSKIALTDKISGLKTEIEKKDTFTQFDYESHSTDNGFQEEYNNIKSLHKSIKKIKVGRISNHLASLYDELKNIKTDIPSPSATPDLQPPELFPTKQTVRFNFTVIKDNIGKILKQVEKPISRLKIDKETQADFEFKNQMVIALESMNKDKDIDMVKMKSKYEIMTSKITKLQESLIRSNDYCQDLEGKLCEKEIEFNRMKNSFNLAVEKCSRIEKAHAKLEENLEGIGKDNKKCRKRIKELERLLKKKQKDLQNVLDRLYNTQIVWKISEKKLRQIEKAYFKTVGSNFKYKDINIVELTKKFGIRKISLGDVEDEIKLLENEELDLDEPVFGNTNDLLDVGFISDQNVSFNEIRSSSKIKNTQESQKEMEKGNEEEQLSKNSKSVRSSMNRGKNRQVYRRQSTIIQPEEKTTPKITPINKAPETQRNINKSVTFETNTEEKDPDDKKVKVKEDILEEVKLLAKPQVKKNDSKVIERLDTNESKQENIKKNIKYENKVEKPKPKPEIETQAEKNITTVEEKIIPSNIQRKNTKKNTEQPTKETKKVLINCPTPKPSEGKSETSKNENIKSDNFRQISLSEKRSSSVPKKEINDKEVNDKEIVKKLLDAGSFDNSDYKPELPIFKFLPTNNIAIQSDSYIRPPIIAPFKSETMTSEQKYNNFSNKQNKNYLYFNEKEQSTLSSADTCWISTLSEDQQKSFSFFQEKLNEKKRFYIENCSKSIECLLLNDSTMQDLNMLYFSKQRKKHFDILSKIFDNSDDLDVIPDKYKMQIAYSLQGHHKKRCTGNCVHLKRIHKIKIKCISTPYPIKYVKL